MNSDLLTINQVADMLNTSTRTVRRLVKRKQLHAPVKYGNNVRWLRQWVLDFIERLAKVGTLSVNQTLL